MPLRPARLSLLVLILVGQPGLAGAQAAEATPAEAAPSENELAAARQAFAEGLRLEEFRDFVGALEQFERVAAIKLTPQVRFHRALCLEKLGRWTDAREEFVRARAEATGNDPQLDLVRRNSAEHIILLDQRTPTLTLTLTPRTARVMIDTRVLPADQGSRPIPLDPGPHLLRATATGYQELLERLDASAGKPLAGRVVLRPLAERPSPDGTGLGRAPFYVSGGIAVASLVASVVFYGLRASTMDDLDRQCGAARATCPASARPLDDRGKTFTTLGNVFLGVGIAATGVGIGSWALIGRRGGESDRTSPKSRLELVPLEGR